MFDALKHGPKITFAVERRAIVGKPARICWEPVGLIQAHTLEGAIEKAAFMCGSPSVLRATEMTVSPVPKAILNEIEQQLEILKTLCQ